MGISFPNPIDTTKKLFNAADNIKDTVVKKTVSTTVEISQDAKNVALGTLNFQASVTRLGLEKTFDAAQTSAKLTLGGINTTRRLFDIDFTPGADLPPAAQGLEFSETKGASDLAYDAKRDEVYRFPDGSEWTVVDVEEDNHFTSGFRAIALQNGDRTIVAFAGTNPKQIGDISNDIDQAAGLTPRQYRQAVEFAQRWEDRTGGRAVLTGHSLGGGLAAYASIRTGLRATTVNSAPLALTNVGGFPLSSGVRNNPNITHYYVPGEALTVLDQNNRFDMRPGNKIAVEGRGSILNPRSLISNHLIDNVAPDVPLPVRVR